MSYPKKEVVSDYGVISFIEMTPEEYEQNLDSFRDKINKFSSSANRKDKEYGAYLRRWFSEEICDGAPFSLKYKLHRLPMTFNQYTWG